MNNKASSRKPQLFAAAGVLLFGALMIGCQKTAAEAEFSAPQAPTIPSVSSSATQGGTAMTDLQDIVKKDMAYADLRRLLLNGGWEPVKDPQCQLQVAGYDEKTCNDNPDLALCGACEQMPELSAYSGDGFATSQFRDMRTGKTLKVVSYGMIEDWDVPGEDSRLRVEEWEGTGTQAQK